MKVTAFHKLHALGNDFILFDLRRTPALFKRFTRKSIASIGDRKTGLGFDQLILLLPSRKADVKIVFFNQDGSRARMCGNGIRAAAYFIARFNKKQAALIFESDSGLRRTHILKQFNVHALVEASMGTVKVGSKSKDSYSVNVGNPHEVHFKDPDLIQKIANKIPTVNIEYARKEAGSGFSARVVERGVGETLACGTGAVAIAAAARSAGMLRTNQSSVRVRFPGGVATVRFQGEQTWLQGTAHYVCSGSISL